MPQFMLLLHETPTRDPNLSPEEIQTILGKYLAWRGRLEEEGRYVASHKLAEEAGRQLLPGNGAVRVVDGPYAEAKELLGGYFLIEAADYDEAVAVAESCPHLAYGGRIEVRQVDVIET